jgi:hypothetical protein
MYSAQASILHAQHCGASRALTGSDAERNVLLQRLSQLVDLPANFGFVFDSPAVPNEKRNTRVGTRPHGLTRDFKDLIDGFGFQIIDVSFFAQPPISAAIQQLLGTQRSGSGTSVSQQIRCY